MLTLTHVTLTPSWRHYKKTASASARKKMKNGWWKGHVQRHEHQLTVASTEEAKDAVQRYLKNRGVHMTVINTGAASLAM